ncbi:MAG: hypothetical protein IJD01_01525 [Clostridia bacterium]|nr:hypothetical protein [Clostridia bacterium]MBQ4119052.1 hypothetical protein [Clostridia bacterium]
MEKEYMSGCQLRQYLHISTRKMKYLMDNNYIPHENTGHATHKYKVLIEDAEHFKWRMENEVGFLAELVGMFSNRTEWHPRVLLEPTKQNCKEFMQWLKFEWQELPDAVPTSEVSRLLGCRPQLIHQIAREGGFTAIKIGCTQYISKKELIIYASSPEKVSNPTGEKYKALIKTFKAKRSREIENEKRREKRRLARIEKGY